MAQTFLEDIYPKDSLYALTVRSPVAKGRLKKIGFPAIPDEYTIITSKDIPGENRIEGTSIPVFADKELSYIGEPIALLLGPNKTILEDLLRQCKIDYDEDPPFLDMPHHDENETSKPAVKREILIGDTKDIFSKSNKLFKSSYVTGIQDHWYAEPAGAVTWYEKDGDVLVVKTATQWPNHVKRSINLLLGKNTIISVEPTSLSLHMDGKYLFPSHVSCHAALASYVTKKPVRLILNREEDFLYSPKRCKTYIDITSTIDINNKITAAEIDICVNLGAHAVNAHEILDHHCLGILGVYKFDNLKLTARAIETNIPPQGPFSGFGISHGTFAIERHLSLIADSVNQDPAQLRKAMLNPHSILPKGVSFRNQIPVETLIDTAAEKSDYYRKWASYELLRQDRRKETTVTEKNENPRGIGISVGFQGNSLLYNGSDKGTYAVEVTLTKDSKLEINTNIISSSNDYERIWAKVASEVISIDPEKIFIVPDDAPDCGPAICSRNITVVTKLVEKCCHAIKKQRFHAPLPITVRRSIKPQYGSLWGGKFLPPEGKQIDTNGFVKLGQACAVVDVSLDLIECIPKIRGIWLTVDGGKIISEHRARREINRSAVQALGWSFYENLEYSFGELPKYRYDNFVMPPLKDIPPIHIDFIPNNSCEPKGIGELIYSCIPSAFLQAVSQAVDYSFKSIPLKRQEIWDIVCHRIGVK